VRRIGQHKMKAAPGFSARYGCNRLVWFEVHANAASAITGEKRIKDWRLDWQVALIERENPERRDLHPDILG
jgi:putative endonuclease